MKLRIFAIFLTSILYAAIAFAENIDRISPPKHVQSLDQLSKLFKSKRGLTNFGEELDGIPRVDKLGTNLPAGLTKENITRLIAPNEDISLVTLVGAKPFPYRLHSYIVIACFAPSKKELAFSGKSCEKKNYNRDDDIYLGLIEYFSTDNKADLNTGWLSLQPLEVLKNVINLTLTAYLESKPKLIAKSLAIKTGWNFIITEQFRSAIRENRSILPNGNYKEFDLAPFKVSDTQTAFGLRVGQTDGYSGGNGYFEVLTLFIVDKDRIINILAEPIYFYQNIAGAWNKNQTRQHYLYEGENVLVVLPTNTNGYYDLQIKSLDSKWQRIFSWNNSQKRYLPISVR
jgi:hypothetical protein